MPKSSMPKKENRGNQDIGKAVSDAFSGILGGLTEIIERLGEIAEKGGEISRGGEFTVDTNLKDKEFKGVYGFSIKTGIGGQKPTVEPFGNIRKDKATGRTIVEEVREPIVDVFEEEDHVLVVAEMPGIEAEGIDVDIQDDILTISAEKGRKKYRKEVLLPKVCDKDRISISGNNGIVEIKCMKCSIPS